MKSRILLIFVLTFIFSSSFSQSNFRRWSVGINTGGTIDYMDFRFDKPRGYNFEGSKSFETNKGLAIGLNTDYYVTPYVSVGLYGSYGRLKNGTDDYRRKYIADYMTFEFKGTVVAGQFFRYDVDNWLLLFKNFYFSTGFGYITGKNNVKDYDSAKDFGPTEANGYKRSENPIGNRQHPGDFGKSSFGALTVPVEVGYHVNCFDDYDEIRHVISIGFKTNFSTTDNINGYSDNINAGFQNLFTDTYGTLSISYKYHFGSFGTYYKPIRSFF